MAQSPDIRVRLTPEGTQEVVNAFKRVQREGKSTERSMEGIRAVGASLARLLPQISFAAVVAGAVALTRSAITAADELGKMAQRVGVSTESLSELGYSAGLAGVSMEQLGTGLRQLAKNMADTQRGTGEAVAAFNALGINVESSAGVLKSSEAIMLEIAERFANMQDGAGKTAIAMRLFGEAGAQLIPLLNQGAKGLRENAAEARRLGIVVGGEASRAAETFRDNLERVRAGLRGFGFSIANEVMPWLNRMVEQLLEGTRIAGGFLNALRLFGLSGITSGNAGAQISEITREIERLEAARARAIEQGRTRGSLIQNFDREIADAKKQVEFARFLQRQAAIESSKALGGDTPGERARLGANIAPKQPAPRLPSADAASQAFRAAQARLQFLKSQLDGEQRLFAAQNKLIESQDKIAFDRGLISLQEYHNRRRALMLADADKEIDVLQRTREIVASGPVRDVADVERRNSELAALDNQIKIARIERERAAGEATAAQAQAEQQLADQRLRFEQSALAAAGRRKEAAIAALDEEIRRYEDLLRLQGVADTERARLTGQRRAVGERNIELDALREQADLQMRELAVARETINAQVVEGAIFQFEGEQRILELEQQRLPVLREIAASMLEIAEQTGDALRVQEAREFGIAVEQIAVSVNKAGQEMAAFKQQAFDAVSNALTDFLTSGIENAKSLGEAFKSMARSIIQSLRQIAAQIVATEIAKKLFAVVGLPFPVGRAQGGAVERRARGGIVLRNAAAMHRYAAGGHIRGPGGPTGDRIPALLSDGEFVLRSAVVRQPGMQQFLQDLNSFGSKRLREPVRGFADGGLVGDAEGGTMATGFRGDVVIGLDDALVAKRIFSSSEGVRLLTRAISANKRAIRSGLGI